MLAHFKNPFVVTKILFDDSKEGLSTILSWTLMSSNRRRIWSAASSLLQFYPKELVVLPILSRPMGCLSFQLIYIRFVGLVPPKIFIDITMRCASSIIAKKITEWCRHVRIDAEIAPKNRLEGWSPLDGSVGLGIKPWNWWLVHLLQFLDCIPAILEILQHRSPLEPTWINISADCDKITNSIGGDTKSIVGMVSKMFSNRRIVVDPFLDCRPVGLMFVT